MKFNCTCCHHWYDESKESEERPGWCEECVEDEQFEMSIFDISGED